MAAHLCSIQNVMNQDKTPDDISDRSVSQAEDAALIMQPFYVHHRKILILGSECPIVFASLLQLSFIRCTHQTSFDYRQYIHLPPPKTLNDRLRYMIVSVVFDLSLHLTSAEVSMEGPFAVLSEGDSYWERPVSHAVIGYHDHRV